MGRVLEVIGIRPMKPEVAESLEASTSTKFRVLLLSSELKPCLESLWLTITR